MLHLVVLVFHSQKGKNLPKLWKSEKSNIENPQENAKIR